VLRLGSGLGLGLGLGVKVGVRVVVGVRVTTCGSAGIHAHRPVGA
jgi:hypothetical protein